MSSGFRREIILLLAGITLAVIVGWFEDAVLAMLCAVMAAYIAWNLYNLFLITRWLEKPGKKRRRHGACGTMCSTTWFA